MNGLSAVGLWAPLEFAVFAHSYVFADGVELVHYVFAAEALNVLRLEHLCTLVLHAGKTHCISVIDLYLQVVTITINAESVPTGKREEVFGIVRQVTAVAELCIILTFFDWGYLDVEVAL